MNCFCPDVPAAVAINEAVELAKLYSTGQSSRFVNGILSSVAKLKFAEDGQNQVEEIVLGFDSSCYRHFGSGCFLAEIVADWRRLLAVEPGTAGLRQQRGLVSTLAELSSAVATNAVVTSLKTGRDGLWRKTYRSARIPICQSLPRLRL